MASLAQRLEELAQHLRDLNPKTEPRRVSFILEELNQIEQALRAATDRPSGIHWLSTEEAADRSGYAPWTIRQYCRDGTLEARKLGDEDQAPWRIPEREIDRLIEERGTSV